ncbi:MAG: transposase family protein [Candidatus Rokubacteria bacterium]|nr:transposase family protein [Candidatus Rokubacteria bacterium]
MTAWDAACSYGVAWVLPELSAEAAATFLRQILGPVYRRADWPLQRVLTDGGSEFKGAFAEACRALRITHTRTLPRHAWTNGFVERLQGTILHEHWRIEFRREESSGLLGDPRGRGARLDPRVRPTPSTEGRVPGALSAQGPVPDLLVSGPPLGDVLVRQHDLDLRRVSMGAVVSRGAARERAAGREPFQFRVRRRRGPRRRRAQPRHERHPALPASRSDAGGAAPARGPGAQRVAGGRGDLHLQLGRGLHQGIEGLRAVDGRLSARRRDHGGPLLRRDLGAFGAEPARFHQQRDPDLRPVLEAREEALLARRGNGARAAGSRDGGPWPARPDRCECPRFGGGDARVRLRKNLDATLARR